MLTVQQVPRVQAQLAEEGMTVPPDAKRDRPALRSAPGGGASRERGGVTNIFFFYP